MRRPSWLDSLVERFQDNWETKAQFRAMITGVAGLLVIALLCAALGAAASFAGAVGNVLGGGGASTYVSQVQGANTPTPITFPWSTLPPWTNPVIPPASSLGPSQTPQPTPTFAPTPTLVPTATIATCYTNCGGGGPSDTITVSVSPATFTNGTQVTANIHTSTPNEGFSVFTYWPSGGVIPQRTGTVDGNGNGSLALGAIPGGCPGKLKLWVTTQNNGNGVTVTFPC
jgi:hypothetical protein